MNSVRFKNVIYKMYLQMFFFIYFDEEDLSLRNQQWLLCHEIQPN